LIILKAKLPNNNLRTSDVLIFKKMLTQPLPWYRKTIPEIFELLHSFENGLTKEEAGERLLKYGQNKLPEGKVESLFLIFLRQFQSPFIYILLVAAVIVLAMGQIIDSLVILAVLIFNAIMGTIQEGKAQNTLLALKKFVHTPATVRRDGKEFIIPDIEVVPGDIIVLEGGEKIPADARIIFANTLKVDEASLTGESGPVAKTEAVLPIPQSSQQADLPVTAQKNMLFKGTHILSGNGTAIVVATGLKTEIGKIAQKIATVNTEIPLKTEIRYLSRLIIFTVFGLDLLLIVLGIFFNHSLKEMFTTAVSLSVSIIPEGLPIVMTLILATGVSRMSKRHVLVKKLQAVESLGQTKVLAVDKTGTLTKNEMVIQKVYTDGKIFEVTGSGYEPKGEIIFNGEIITPLNHPELVLSGQIAAFCANARLSFLEDTNTWKISGDPTETAMLVFSRKIGFNYEILEQETPKIFEMPFDYQKKYHTIVRVLDKKNFLTVVGAPEKVFKLCKKLWHKDKTETLNEKKRQELESVFLNLAQNGFRVVAYAVNPNVKREINPQAMPPLIFVGFFAMKDSLRPEVKETVQKVRETGMSVVMITGDHYLTARAIAKEVGIYQEGNLILTGEEIDKMVDEELAKKLDRATVFARVTPEHKLRLIQAYHRQGKVVAMTGDGVNDAPSLVAADLGVAMGKIGTEVAKEASDIVLLDDNFASIIAAAEEGRSIYKTIKKVILYLFSTSVGEALTIFGALMLGYPLPLLPAQIIWLNFVTDGFLDVSLAMEPKEKGLLREKFKRPKKWMVDSLMTKRIFFMTLPMIIGTLFLFKGYFETDLAKAFSISLTSLAVFQWFNAWNCRSEDKSIFQMNPFSNKFLVASTITVILLQLAALNTPFLQKVLNTQPLTLKEWFTIIFIAFSIIAVEEIRKFLYRKFSRSRQRKNANNINNSEVSQPVS